jgi:circadian clock protein KaiB
VSKPIRNRHKEKISQEKTTLFNTSNVFNKYSCESVSVNLNTNCPHIYPGFAIMDGQLNKSPDITVLRLYVAGDTLKSRLAVANLRGICEKYLKGHCDVDIIDISKHPDMAIDKNISAIPTLIKELPMPVRTLIGDLASKEDVLIALDIKHVKGEKAPKTEVNNLADLKTENEKLMDEVAKLRAENDHLRRMLRKGDH